MRCSCGFEYVANLRELIWCYERQIVNADLAYGSAPPCVWRARIGVNALHHDTLTQAKYFYSGCDELADWSFCSIEKSTPRSPAGPHEFCFAQNCEAECFSFIAELCIFNVQINNYHVACDHANIC